MNLCEELKNRVNAKLGMNDRLIFYSNFEQEQLFNMLRSEANKGESYCIIHDYALVFPYLVKSGKLEEILTSEGLTFDYIQGETRNDVDCLVKW